MANPYRHCFRLCVLASKMLLLSKIWLVSMLLTWRWYYSAVLRIRKVSLIEEWKKGESFFTAKSKIHVHLLRTLKRKWLTDMWIISLMNIYQVLLDYVYAWKRNYFLCPLVYFKLKKSGRTIIFPFSQQQLKMWIWAWQDYK